MNAMFCAKTFGWKDFHVKITCVTSVANVPVVENLLLLCYYSINHSSKSKKVSSNDFMAREQIIHWIQLLGQGMGQVWALKNFPDEKGDPKNLEKNYRRKWFYIEFYPAMPEYQEITCWLFVSNHTHVKLGSESKYEIAFTLNWHSLLLIIRKNNTIYLVQIPSDLLIGYHPVKVGNVLSVRIGKHCP